VPPPLVRPGTVRDAGGDLPDTERAGKGIVSLPLFPGMSDADVDYVCEAVREIVPGGRP
jgi:dTDP-4-amino-4,6-dideoxygalactose transaminase